MLIAIAIAEKILELPRITLNSIWIQKSEFRNLASKIRIQNSEVKNQNSEIRIQYFEFTYQNSHIRIHKSEFTNQNSQIRIHKLEFRNLISSKKKPRTSHDLPLNSHWTPVIFHDFFHFLVFFFFFPENFTPRDAHCFWQWASKNCKQHWCLIF